MEESEDAELYHKDMHDIEIKVGVIPLSFA